MPAVVLFMVAAVSASSCCHLQIPRQGKAPAQARASCCRSMPIDGDEFNLWQDSGTCSFWLPILGNMSCRPSSSPPAITLASDTDTTCARSEATLACTQQKHSLLQHLSLKYIIKDLSPPLLHGPKATIVFVVVIDIFLQPYNTKQSDHDSDANVEVERVF